MGAMSMALSFGIGYVVGAKGREIRSRVLRGATRDLFALRPPERSPSTSHRLSGDLRVRDLMTEAPRCVSLDTSVGSAAQLMADNDLGDVIVVEPGTGVVVGIVTDRDITVRAIAKGLDPLATTVEEIFSRDLVAVAPEDPIPQALELMDHLKVRRLPVVEGDRAVGIVSLGDLSVQTDAGPVLASISRGLPDH